MACGVCQVIAGKEHRGDWGLGMARKGGLRHLKRLASPSFWPVRRKEAAWVSKPNAGAHSASRCLPLKLIIRDELHLGKNGREVGSILAGGKVNVDGRPRRDRNYSIGLMDVVEFTEANATYRLLPVEGRGLSLIKITKEEAKFKLCKVLHKGTAPGGRVTYGMHDGRTLTVKPTEAESVDYSTNDTLRMSVPTQRVLDRIKFEKGTFALVIAGRNEGKSGKIVELQRGTATRPATVTIEDKTGNRFDTRVDYTFVVGTNEPAIRLGVQ